MVLVLAVELDSVTGFRCGARVLELEVAVGLGGSGRGGLISGTVLGVATGLRVTTGLRVDDVLVNEREVELSVSVAGVEVVEVVVGFCGCTMDVGGWRPLGDLFIAAGAARGGGRRRLARAARRERP